jgi:hypothetical protein
MVVQYALSIKLPSGLHIPRRGLELRREVDLWCALRRYSDHTVRGTALPAFLPFNFGLSDQNRLKTRVVATKSPDLDKFRAAGSAMVLSYSRWCAGGECWG